jgi:hypothetical protein
MALATYSDLLASVAAWLNRSDLTAVIPDFVSLAEGRIARDLRLRKQVVNTTLSTVAGTQAVTLPSDFLEAENLVVTNTSPAGALSVVTPEYLDRKFPESANYTGQPLVYTIIGDTLVFGPTPDGVYTVDMSYYQRFTALATASTNWLLTNHPAVYLNACLVEGSAYLMDADKAQAYESRYQAAINDLQFRDDAALRSGSAMRVRAL